LGRGGRFDQCAAAGRARKQNQRPPGKVLQRAGPGRHVGVPRSADEIRFLGAQGLVGQIASGFGIDHHGEIDASGVEPFQQVVGCAFGHVELDQRITFACRLRKPGIEQPAGSRRCAERDLAL